MFFILGPLLFLIVHAYTLLHFALLAGKISAFDSELEKQIGYEDTRARLRRQLPSNIFVQFLAGPRDIRRYVIGWMLRLIAWISLILGPIVLLVFFQLQFLPYHDLAVSWWQRLAVVLDLLLLWALWPSIARGDATGLRWQDFRYPKTACLALASVLPALFVVTVATFPGEWLDEHAPSIPFVPASWAPVQWASVHEILIAGQPDADGQRPKRAWSNRLVLPDIDFIDHVRFEPLPQSQSH
jgi:hypothetical protein